MHPARKPLLAAALLVVIGVLCFALQPAIDPEPDSECVAANEPSSGFRDEDKDCNISQESWAEIAEWNSNPKPLRIFGLVFILAGVVVGVIALLRRRRGSAGSPAP